MNATLSLGLRLAAARTRGKGGGVLDGLAIGAYAASAWLALTVAGGVWMFWQRSANPQGAVADVANQFGSYFLGQYISFAAIAAALLILPIIGLDTAAATLGARGRSRRLASLRLLGATGGRIVALSLIETVLQCAVGIAVGLALWLLSLPAWGLISFHTVPIAAGEMLVPWWLGLAIVAGLMALALVSTTIALRRVRISPLGVANQVTPRGLTWARGIAIVVAVLALIYASSGLQVRGVELAVYASFAVIVLVVIGAINVVGPWLLQLIARPLARTSSAPRLVAMRRILDDPKAAWKNVSAVALLGLVGAFVSILPSDAYNYGGPGSPNFVLFGDIRTGVVIALAISFLVATVSTVMNQASSIVDRSGESVAQAQMGMPNGMFGATRRWLVVTPLLVAMVMSLSCGMALTLPFVSDLTTLAYSTSNLVTLGVIMVVGLTMILAASAGLGPLQRSVLTLRRRRND